jgi:methyltransferase (TIGR00027 family)
MRARTVSRTALWVAYLRALAHAGMTGVRGFTDPTARQLLDEGWRKRLEKTERSLAPGRPRGRMTRALLQAVDILAQRTLVIDEAVRREVAHGTRQLVILGAGLDGRAWRLAELAPVRVFEVDHPATQAYKRSHLAGLGATAASVAFVPVDFEREALEPALAAGGHDAAAPTVWVWEGVVMYLTREALQNSLRALASRSARGSVLILNYHTGKRPGLFHLWLRLIGEPMRSFFSGDEVQAELHPHAFRVEADSGAADWAARHGGPEAGLGVGPRIAVARRT